ncbi:MAG: hypothetical protein J5563_02175 [Clostridia bacterium]|nr:hypothetical protein [Clostridia bacterium]
MYPGVYCTEHIVYLAVTLLLTVAGLAAVVRSVKSDRTLNVVTKLSAAALLAMICVNRVSVTAAQIRELEGYTWLNLLPYTFCGLASAVLSLTVLFTKQERLNDSRVLHFISYFGIFGSVATVFYPDFLEKQTFWDIRSVSGLVHHSLMLWLILLLFSKKLVRPSLKKWYCYPVGYIFVMFIGLLEIEMLNFREAMNIGQPLVGSLPVITSWYFLFFLSSMVVAAVGFVCDAAGKKTVPENMA